MEFFSFDLHYTHSCFLLIKIFVEDVFLAVCTEYHVRLKPKDVLIVTIYHSWYEAEEHHAVFGTQVHTSIKQEMDRSADLAMPDDVLSRNVLTLIHLDNTLVAESFLEELKAGPKLINRIAEEELYKLRLHFG